MVSPTSSRPRVWLSSSQAPSGCFAQEQALPPAAAAGAAADQPGGQHARVVEDEQVAGVEQGRQVVEMAVGRRRAVAAHHQQARLVAFRRRFLGDQAVGKLVIELVDVHRRHGQSSASGRA